MLFIRTEPECGIRQVDGNAERARVWKGRSRLRYGLAPSSPDVSRCPLSYCASVRNSIRRFFARTNANVMYIGRDDIAQDFVVNRDGNVGIGTTSPGNILDVNDNFQVATDGRISNSNRLKANASESFIPLR